jgi:aryl-alcohol dehydrogenase-like predicted oxidoreductase
MITRALGASGPRVSCIGLGCMGMSDLYGPADEAESLATIHAATVAQLAIAWVLSRGEGIIPLVGARRRDRLAEALGALDLALSAADLARIERAVPAEAVAGTRYDARQMDMLDSERA